MGRSRRGWTGVLCVCATFIAACGAFSSATEETPSANDDSGQPGEAGAPDGAPSEDGLVDGQGPAIVCPCPDATEEGTCEVFTSPQSANDCGWKAEPASGPFDYTSDGLVVPTDAKEEGGFLRRKLTGLATLSVEVTASLTSMKSLSTNVIYFEAGDTALTFILYKGLASSALTIGLIGGATTNVSLSSTFKVTFAFTGTSVATTVRENGTKILETTTEAALKSSTVGVGIHHVTTPIGSGTLSFSNLRATFD